MSKNRYAANVDKNQSDIVEDLRDIGCTVELDHDDLLVGTHGFTFWYELKSERAVKKDGTFKKGEIKKGQETLRDTWRGHYKIVSSFDEILADIKANLKKWGK